MTSISDQNIFSLFRMRGNRFRNAADMQLGLTAGMEVWTDFTLCTHDYGPLSISISTEDDDVTAFINGFNLQSVDKVDRLDYTRSWMRYLNSNAEICVIPFELEASLRFRIVKRKTIIFSLDLHFYDEVYEHLTMPEDFENYVSSYQNRLNAAGDNRFRMNKR